MGILTGLLEIIGGSVKADTIDRVTSAGYYDGEHGNPPQWGIFVKASLISEEKAEMLKQYYTEAYKLGQQKAVRKEMGGKLLYCCLQILYSIAKRKKIFFGPVH